MPEPTNEELVARYQGGDEGAFEELLQGLQQTLDLPVIEAPERFDGELGRRLMNVVCPGWRPTS